MQTYGQATSTTQASAMMLYVHSLMGDAQPGEVDPASVLGSGESSTAFQQIFRRGGPKYAGPYTIQSQGASAIGVGGQQTVDLHRAFRLRAPSSRESSGPPRSRAPQGSGSKRLPTVSRRP